MSNSQLPVLGIDLGTSTCLACVQLDGTGRLTTIRPDPRMPSDVMPSYFCWNRQRGALIGEEARQMMRDGRFKQDVVRCVKRKMKESRDYVFSSGGEHFSPMAVSSFYLKHLKDCAERQLKIEQGSLSKLVVTVPAYFGHDERMFTRQAAVDAGFASEEVHLLDEPIAAAYGLRLHQQPGARLAMVVDLGGGTLDVTLLLVGTAVAEDVAGPDGNTRTHRGMYELAREGDPTLGGDCWDRVIGKLLVMNKRLERDADFFEYTNVDLYDASENAKRSFAESGVLRQTVPFFDQVTKQNTSAEITLDNYVNGSKYLVNRSGAICDRLFKSIPAEEVARVERYRSSYWRRMWGTAPRELTWQDVDQIYLVGGGSKLPQFRQCIANYWRKPPTLADYPQHQVAYGAGLIGYDVAQNKDFFNRLLLRSPYSYGCYFYRNGRDAKPEFHPLIRRNQRVPVEVHQDVKVSGGPDAKVFRLEFLEERNNFLEDVSDTTEMEYRPLGQIVIPDLPSTRTSKAETALCAVKYYSDREISVKAEFRGKDVEFHLNQSDTDAST